MKTRITTAAYSPRALALASLGLNLLLAPAAWAQSPAIPASPPAAALSSPAQPATGPWTLQRAVDYALEHNLGVRQNELTAQSNQQVLKQSRAALLPTVNLNGTQNWQFGTSVNPLTFEYQSQTVRANNFSAVSQLALFQGFQLRNTIKRNALDLEASVQDIAKAKNDLSLNVASQFLQLMLAQELVRANQTRVASDQEQITRTKILLKAGSIPESTLLDSQSQLATDELNVITAQNQVDLARLALMQLLNIDPATAKTFEIEVPSLPDPDEEAPYVIDLNETYQGATGRLPEIKAAELRVQSARRSIDLTRGAYYPRLFLNGQIFTGFSSSSVSRVITGTSEGTPIPLSTLIRDASGNPAPFTNGYTFSLPGQPTYDVLPVRFFDQLNNNLGKSIQFSLSVPILNGLQVRTGVQRAIINEQVASVRAEQARLTLRQSIEQAYADARAAQLQYAANKRQVTALTLTQRNAEIRFNNGLLNGTEFNITKNNLTFAESNRIQAKYSFIFRRKVLEFYQGKPLTL
ncbi:TolC family protein [Hymenobacter negativus]|uniref:TolC family protein n=1 Tax=Hymenobacter negativus TaxID=2795026 RepID=A0ABS3QMP4_9BACT|nr:TolC family protein [Hymenobacter negativus]MBO2012555.1 TolC family protein [Hymenobacter negativus]